MRYSECGASRVTPATTIGSTIWSGDKLGLDGFGQGEVHHEAAVYHTSPKDYIILARPHSHISDLLLLRQRTIFR